MPASIAKEYKQVSVGILTAQHLPEMDIALLSSTVTDAFVKTEW